MSNDQESLEKIQESAENGDLEQAFAQCEKIIEQNPGHGEALHLSAYILILQGLPEKAIDRLLQVIGEHPGSPDYHATLAIAYQSDGNKKEACASYRRLLSLVPDDLGALISLAEMNAVNGIDPKNVDIQEGVSARMMGFFVARSFTYFERALAVDSSDPGVADFGQALVRHLQQNMTSKMDAAVPDGIGRGKPKVIYPLRVIGRIGHLIIEPFLLKCLFDPDEYDIIVLTVPLEAAVSAPVFDIALRQTFPVHLTGPSPALELWGVDCGIRVIGETTYVLERVNELAGRVLANMKDGKLPYKLTLNDHEKEQGLKLRSDFNVPADAPIVTLYVREQGYFPAHIHHSHRNADIENYIPAIKYLVEQGFTVVRIGDDKMHRLPDLGPQVIDAPFHPAYDQLVEPYFVSESAFMVKTLSGPDCLSMAFGIPSVITNFYWNAFATQIKDDLCVPKKYYSHRYQRELTLSEIATDKDLLFAGNAVDFTSRHIQLIENTDQEILWATREMVARQRGQFEETTAYDTRFRKLCRRIHEDCENNIYSDGHINLETDYFGPYLGGLKISHTYCDSNPDFLW